MRGFSCTMVLARRESPPSCAPSSASCSFCSCGGTFGAPQHLGRPTALRAVGILGRYQFLLRELRNIRRFQRFWELLGF